MTPLQHSQFNSIMVTHLDSEQTLFLHNVIWLSLELWYWYRESMPKFKYHSHVT